MNKTILTIALTAIFAVGTIFTGCESSQSNVDKAQSKMKEAKSEWSQEKNEANIESEWRMFKTDAQNKIRNNEERIDELQERMENSGKILDNMREKKIADLKKQNRDLRLRVDAYKVRQSDWESFKREFNHDMEEIEDGFESLTTDNKN